LATAVLPEVLDLRVAEMNMQNLVGQVLGHYRVVSRLGSGASGEVYCAKDLRLMREVALKVLGRPEESNRLVTLQSEARMASSLNHPNIVTIHDADISAKTPYIVMELITGKTLREMMNLHLLDLASSVCLGQQVAQGLARAHDEGLVHRDLKPENIMVSKEGLAKVLDFGLAQPAGSQSESTTDGTSFAPLAGTIAYMSPEQAAGKKLDFRSDQFSLGVILYEMVAGERPFHRTSIAQTVAAIIEEPHTPLCSSKFMIPFQFSEIVDKCLAKSPARRFFSTHELARQLAAVQSDLQNAPLRSPVIGVLPFSDLSPDGSYEYFSEGMSEEIRRQLRALPGLTILSRYATPATSWRSLRRIGAATRAERLIEGSVRFGLGRIRVASGLIDTHSGYSIWSEQYDREAHDLLAVQSDVAQRVVTVLEPLLTRQ
jgi:serine/threonine protein kinase